MSDIYTQYMDESQKHYAELKKADTKSSYFIISFI